MRLLGGFALAVIKQVYEAGTKDGLEVGAIELCRDAKAVVEEIACTKDKSRVELKAGGVVVFFVATGQDYLVVMQVGAGCKSGVNLQTIPEIDPVCNARRNKEVRAGLYASTHIDAAYICAADCSTNREMSNPPGICQDIICNQCRCNTKSETTIDSNYEVGTNLGANQKGARRIGVLYGRGRQGCKDA